ncbi:MAG: 2-isopropylmalate synthase [Opitutales bacterium]|nr:2-isopropylmalate synthase [Opitutales bacterium]
MSLSDRTWPDKQISSAPIWCSVDLRDGNQALAQPMSVEEKLEFFDLLVGVGFKQIEIGFPSASDTEFAFTRRLIEEQRIPDDVTIQVLVQCREHLIERTVESLIGAKSVIIHVYNSTNPLQRDITFNKDKSEIKAIAVQGAQWIQNRLPRLEGTSVILQYSPESFSDTETEYALEVCEAVLDVWQPTPERPAILNLPATVEWATPNVHADQIEWFCRHMKRRDRAIISLHTHNDRGTGTAATELALMAGADRVEGTLFGNGERTGNLDIIQVALNMYTQGVDPGLDFSDLPKIRNLYEKVTRMSVHERHPYAGDLVFTAFSGSHQDAIKKGMDRMQVDEQDLWRVPYLPIDPEDIGRSYDAIIRINSQSGKGGVAFILEQEFGLELPKKMHPEVGQLVNLRADSLSRELNADEIYAVFQKAYLDIREPLRVTQYAVRHSSSDVDDVSFEADVIFKGEQQKISGKGNGPISSLVNAIERQGWKDFQLLDYRQHAVGVGSGTRAACYINLGKSGTSDCSVFGAALDSNTEAASIYAVISAFNRLQRLSG